MGQSLIDRCSNKVTVAIQGNGQWIWCSEACRQGQELLESAEPHAGRVSYNEERARPQERLDGYYEYIRARVLVVEP